jgi:flagellar FliL protein
MADEQASANAAANEARTTKKNTLILIASAIVLVIISVTGTVFTMKLIAPEPIVGPGPGQSPLQPAMYFDMAPNFTVHFTVNGRQRFLQAAVSLLYRNPELEPQLALHMPAIRNGLVMLLSSKTFDELQTVEGKARLKEEALDVVNAQLSREQRAMRVPEISIEEVLFTNFVMQ